MRPKIHYLKRGEGQSLILLHGMGFNAESWRYQLEAFSQHYEVFALDLPGYGGSPPLQTVTFQEYAHSLQAFIEGQGLHKPILLGHSFGGMLAQEHMALYPDVAASAILYGTSPAFGNAQGKRQQDFIRTRLQPLEEGKTIPELAEGMLNNMLGTKGISANAKALALKALAQTSEKTYINSIMCLKTFDQRKNLGAITIPCLLLVGSEDKNTPAAMMETMAGKIANAQFCCFANLGHMVHLEDPEGFNETVLAFLAGRDS